LEKNMKRRLSNLESMAYSKNQYLDLLVEIFEQDGWRVKREVLIADRGADLAISRGNLSYTVALKVSSEGRRDRLVAFLSQAILEVRAAASVSPDKPAPLAVIAAPSIPRSTADELIDFRSKVAPDAAVGIFDREGLRRFVGSGIENLTATPPRSARRQKLRVPDSANVFSDLNQWLLKVLLAPLISEDLLAAPRGEYRNASELAEAAEVSVMSAFRFVRQLERDEFLDKESDHLRLVHREELMRRWQAAYLRPTPERPLRIDRANHEQQFPAVLRQFNDKSPSRSAPIACLGVSAAAECLRFEPTQRFTPSFYLENVDRRVLASMGFSPDDAEFRPDLLVRAPFFRKSVFKAAVTRDGILVSDIIQIWLDITSPLAGDTALADEIHQRALAKIFIEQT
jgi:hypothetical protein